MASLKNFKRLAAIGKAWRFIATRLQSKLHKLQQSKSMKKDHINTVTPTRRGNWPSLSFQSRFKRKTKSTRKYPRKKTKPVYIDQLFLQPSTVSTAKTGEKVVNCVEASMARRSRKEDGRNCNHTMMADDMWESLVLTSPQMHGINERAEEFISRFRADLLVQEMMAQRM